MDSARLELLARVASLYYEETLTQAEIARQTGYSRSMISRLLREAREQGVVEIRVHHPLSRHHELEQQLQERFDLRLTRVLDFGDMNYNLMLRRLGALAARTVERLVKDGMTIGISWGTGLAELVQALRPQTLADVIVVQIIGALGTADPNIDGPELARRLAHMLNGRYKILPAPLVVDDQETQQRLKQDRRVQEVLKHAEVMDIVLVGVGTVELEKSSIVRSGYLTPEQVSEIAQAGAVGDVCAIHFNLAGKLVDTPLQRRFVGIDSETLREVPWRLGIAGGLAKAKPIVGAIRAGLINMLITDAVAAAQALRLLEQPAVNTSNKTRKTL